MNPHGLQPPSDWVRRWSHLVPAGGTVLDVACGHGRHLRWFAGRGHPVVGVDRDPAAVAAVGHLGRIEQADIEAGPWPFEGLAFDADGRAEAAARVRPAPAGGGVEAPG